MCAHNNFLLQASPMNLSSAWRNNLDEEDSPPADTFLKFLDPNYEIEKDTIDDLDYAKVLDEN
jgi:hypothetical protein